MNYAVLGLLPPKLVLLNLVPTNLVVGVLQYSQQQYTVAYRYSVG